MKKELIKVFVPVFVPVYKVNILYTKPKKVIPKVKNEAGKLVPNLHKYWYVKYSFRNPKNGKLKEFRIKKGINRLKTISERKVAISNLRIAVERWLQDGYSPFAEKPANNVNQKTFTTKEAIEIALNEKRKVWSEISNKNNTTQINVFIKFLKEQNLYNKNINLVTKRIVIVFLNDLGKKKGKPVNETTRNTYRKNINSLFTQMVNDEIIPINHIESIKILKEKPQKNTPFRKSEIVEIKKYLLEHDPYLYLFIKFVMYGFFRPVEVCRIRVKDINLARNTINVISKTETSIANVVYITKQLKETLLEMKLDNLQPNDFIFTKDLKPGSWNVPDIGKRTWFGNRFLKLKRALKFSSDYGIYSFRHTAAIDLFTTYQKQGLTDLEAKQKMLPITRHKSIDSLNKYLRDIGASLPKDYSDDYSLDF